MKRLIILFCFLPFFGYTQFEEFTEDVAKSLMDSINRMPDEQYTILEQLTEEHEGYEIIVAVNYPEDDLGRRFMSKETIALHYGLRKDGKILAKPFYSRVIPWEDGFIFKRYKDVWMTTKDGDFDHLIRQTGVVPYSYLVEKDGKFGILDESLETLIPCEYQAILDENPWVEFIDVDWSMEYEMKFTSFIAKKDGKWGILDSGGSIRLPFEYEGILEYYKNDFIVCRKNGKWGITDFEQKELIPFDNDSIVLSGDCFHIKKGNKWGFVSYAEELVGNEIGFNYDDMIPSRCGRVDFAAKVGKRWYFYDGYEGKETQILSYHEELYAFEDVQRIYDDSGWELDYIGVKVKGKWAIFDCANFQFHTQPIYKKIVRVEKELDEQHPDAHYNQHWDTYIIVLNKGKEEKINVNER